MAGGGVGEQLQDRQRRHGFARAALADQRQRFAAVEGKGNAFDRFDRRRAAPAGESHAKVADLEEAHPAGSHLLPLRPWGRRGATCVDAGFPSAHGVTLRGSKASRTASPMKINRLSMIASTRKAVMPSHGACRLALPCAKSSPSEAEPGGRPKPRKSSEVRVVIEPFRMNGMKVIVATVAFGNTWRQMMTGSETPRARAART